MFELLVSVADSNGIDAAILLFIILGAAGIWAVVQFAWNNWVIVLAGGSIAGIYIFNWWSGLVDRVLGAYRGR